MSKYSPPYPPYDPTDKTGFSYETVVKRWPIILTSLIDTVYQENMALMSGAADEDVIRDKAAEGKIIIQTLSKLKYEMGRNRELEIIPEDGGANILVLNSLLDQLRDQGSASWFSSPWLYAECYLYRLVRTYFARTTFWKEYDPFRIQKEGTFKSSASAVYQLAHTFSELNSKKEALGEDPAKLEALFNEMLQICLWGNATDLSLLTNMTHEDIQKLQSVGRAAQEERKESILLDNSAVAWKHLSSVKEGRVDLVLDNAGFELFTDLLFADFLITYTPYVSRVVFQLSRLLEAPPYLIDGAFSPKTIPWFVSDVLPADFRSTFISLMDASFFGDYSPSPTERRDLEVLAHRWQEHLSSGRFSLSVPSDSRIGEPNPLADFWTSPSPFAVMENEAPVLTRALKGSALVIFKGDLNYRKLTADVKWPPSTPFPVALGPLAGLFPILSLRTLKADVVVGLTEDHAMALDVKDPKWRVNGKYGLISFAPESGPS